MKERPILFKGEMVRAILDGRKTQTRRPVKPQDAVEDFEGKANWVHDVRKPHPCEYACSRSEWSACPYGQVGDRLWVRETFQPLFAEGFEFSDTDYETGKGYQCRYMATDAREEFFDCTTDRISDRMTPSIYMPRWASRITLEITGVRVERLKDISEEDAKAEGVQPVEIDVVGDPVPANHALAFAWLWDAIHGADQWDANPWVWVLEFKRVNPPAEGSGT